MFTQHPGPADDLGQPFNLTGLPDAFRIVFVGLPADLRALLFELESLHLDRADLPMVRKRVLYRWILFADHFDINTIGARYRRGVTWVRKQREAMVRELNTWTEFSHGREAAIPACMVASAVFPNPEPDQPAAPEPGTNDAKYAIGGVPTIPRTHTTAVHGEMINFLDDETREEVEDEWRVRHWRWLRVVTEDGQKTEGVGWTQRAVECECCQCVHGPITHFVDDVNTACCERCCSEYPSSTRVVACAVREVTGQWRAGAQGNQLIEHGLLHGEREEERSNESTIASNSR